MGKSPGKWIKTVLFGKKSSKSSTVKGREKTANEKGTLVTVRASEADVSSVPRVISHPIPTVIDRTERTLEQATANLQHEGGIILPGNQDTLQGSTPQNAPSDPEKKRQEKAATMAQAAFRGYLGVIAGVFCSCLGPNCDHRNTVYLGLVFPNCQNDSSSSNQHSFFGCRLPYYHLLYADHIKTSLVEVIHALMQAHYLKARRAFKALKGIIRLQALIRGHLVRRQAVATLCCVLGVVKLQALARGIKIRNSHVGQVVHKKCSLIKSQVLQDSNGGHISIQKAKTSGNAFVRKLLAPSPIVMPMCLYYDSEEPNSVLIWLERWSASCFWKPVPQPKKMCSSKTQRKQGNGQMVESETGRPKRSVRRVPAANVDNTSIQATPECEKPKNSLRKVSTHPTDVAQENPQHELEKVKRNLRKVHNPVVENSVQPEVEIEKSKQSLERVSGALGDIVLVQSTINSGEKTKKETTLTTPKLADVVKSEPTVMSPKSPDMETTPEPLEVSKAPELLHWDQPVAESRPSVESDGKDENIPASNGELSHKEDTISNQNHKSGRKTYILVKQEHENGVQSSPTLPSYMAATESAKAKLRMQGSPRFSQDGVEKNSVTRRHSLPSSTNNKISSESPRTRRAVHSGGKGGNKGDRSLLSSRDGIAKGIQVEWRR